MSAFAAGYKAAYACLAAWADLLDEINVYPVADGDTGSNLRLSLAPLLAAEQLDPPALGQRLLRAALGNSGNIAVAFLRPFCQAGHTADLAKQAVAGNEAAQQAVADPKPGTMLSVFDQLAATLTKLPADQYSSARIIPPLQATVLASAETLPEMREAGVVDAGALAMYIFFVGFFQEIHEDIAALTDLFGQFQGKLHCNHLQPQPTSNDYCVDVTLTPHGADHRPAIQQLGDSVVIMADEEQLKIHIHTPDPTKLKEQFQQLGAINQWNHEAITAGTGQTPSTTGLHIVTDAAASLPRDLAEKEGISLLDSYIINHDQCQPESLCDPAQIYEQLRQGAKITTAQAANFERHHHYQRLCAQFDSCLYLCVGSAFTGNFQVATTWQQQHNRQDHFTIIDSGAASGRLALIALRTARLARHESEPAIISNKAKELCERCQEYVFIDKLQYLVAGGRLSRTSGFMGKLLHLKPIISPQAEGVRKEGVVRSSEGQLRFARHAIARFQKQPTPAEPLILLQYSDNKEWLAETVLPEIKEQCPQAEIIMVPLSLTSGVHMGPGTWAMALA